ncbi:MAG TPA: hypothetical protein VN822_14200 [Candidatus Acidoferrales bacterium]|nr:hypothetical protein [Candidatus Acidoferrales bacterium]
MAYVKRIVCLANSYKPPNGRCIAGKEVLADGYGGWIRPVSGRSTAEVSFSEYRYEDNTSPKLLDIVDVPLLNADPRHHQVENHVIAAARWVKRGELPWDELEQLRDRPASLWINSGHTNAGHYDCISHAEAATVQDSLLLIRVDDFVVEIGRNHWTGRKSYRGKFEYNGVHHNLSVTDPIVRDAFAAKEEADYPLKDVYVCVSLTEPYEHDDRCHKLVAAIITKRPL